MSVVHPCPHALMCPCAHAPHRIKGSRDQGTRPQQVHLQVGPIPPPPPMYLWARQPQGRRWLQAKLLQNQQQQLQQLEVRTLQACLDVCMLPQSWQS